MENLEKFWELNKAWDSHRTDGDIHRPTRHGAKKLERGHAAPDFSPFPFPSRDFLPQNFFSILRPFFSLVFVGSQVLVLTAAAAATRSCLLPSACCRSSTGGAASPQLLPPLLSHVLVFSLHRPQDSRR